MKVVLSRKGFDSSAGGGPSPVLPDGTMASLPVPEQPPFAGGSVSYEAVAVAPGWTAGSLARALGTDDAVLARGAHLDPDLDAAARPRPAGWRPVFGQAGAAAAHLSNQGVGVGDTFVFWGLFRHTVVTDGALSWDRSRPAFHAVFGWLAVGAVVHLARGDAAPTWAVDHPHVAARSRAANTLYVAAERGPGGLPGGGRLAWDDVLRLSLPEGPRSSWELPLACHPDHGGAELTYHRDRSRWGEADGRARLRAVPRGQEFVVEAAPGWSAWLERVLAAGARPARASPGEPAPGTGARPLPALRPTRPPP